jgi:hypothetical protein
MPQKPDVADAAVERWCATQRFGSFATNWVMAELRRVLTQRVFIFNAPEPYFILKLSRAVKMSVL